MKGKDVRLVSMAGLAAMRTFFGEGGAIAAVRRLAGFHFFRQVRDTLQHACGLINIIAQGLEPR